MMCLIHTDGLGSQLTSFAKHKMFPFMYSKMDKVELSTTVPHNKWGGSRGSLPSCCLFRRLSLRRHLTKSAPG